MLLIIFINSNRWFGESRRDRVFFLLDSLESTACGKKKKTLLIIMRKRVIYIFFVITLQHPDAEGSTGFNGPFTRQHTFIPINQVKSRFISAASSLVSEFGSKHIIQHCIKESYTLTATNLVTSFILNRKLKTTKKRRQRRKESEIHTQCPGPRSSGIISTEKTQSTGSCRSH